MKEVLDARLPVQVSGPGGEIRHLGGESRRLMNPADRTALEIALELRDLAGEGSRVEAFSVSPRDREGALYHCRARGADRVERIEPWPEVPAPLGTVLALAGRLGEGGFDLVCCGDETLDNSSAAVGPLLAEILGWPQITSICKIREFSEGRLVALRKLEKGHREAVESSLPVVATFVPEAAQPRYVSLRRLEQARRATIPVFTNEGAGDPKTLPAWPQGERPVPPRARIKKRFVPDASLSAADRIKAIMAGGSQTQSSSTGSIVEGDVAHVVEQLFRFLRHHEFV